MREGKKGGDNKQNQQPHADGILTCILGSTDARTTSTACAGAIGSTDDTLTQTAAKETRRSYKIAQDPQLNSAICYAIIILVIHWLAAAINKGKARLCLKRLDPKIRN